MKNQKISVYNLTKEFKEECFQEIVKIKQFCIANEIPFYMTFATSNQENGTDYITAKQLPPECDTTLSDDKLRRLILAERGFDIAMNNLDTMDMDIIAPI